MAKTKKSPPCKSRLGNCVLVDEKRLTQLLADPIPNVKGVK
ncbi:unnamed protein product [marine sediment metagenome]|uniref:Uncharacterized protein n=1 Tax=marine sediment metagenome TaxID=412755 RepID=X1C3Q3_9ZZZZ